MTPPDPHKPLRVGVLLSGGGRTLKNLIARRDAGELDIDVPIVIASRQCGGVDWARSRGIDARVVPYRDMPDLATYSEKITDLLDRAAVDLVVLAGFLSMWQFPDRYDGRVINIHPALLPDFGGKGMHGHHVHEAVLAAGRPESGCSVHFCTNDQYDAGPVILQKRVPVEPDDTPDTLAARVFQAECQAYPQAVQWFAEGRVRMEDGQAVIDDPAG